MIKFFVVGCWEWCKRGDGGGDDEGDDDNNNNNNNINLMTKLYKSYRIFGFISRKRGSSSAGSQSSPGGNECHLFADYETGYPAERVVELINKILGENGYNVFS